MTNTSTPTLGRFKEEYLAQWFQFVLFDENGTILDSNNSLMDISEQYGGDIYELNPFLDSIRSAIEALDEVNDEIFFPRMEIPMGEREGVFDYTIRRLFNHGDKGLRFVWVVHDNTYHNQYLSLVQQERNDSVILRELESLKDENTKLNEEVARRTEEITRKKDEIEAKNQNIVKSIQYASRIQRALLPHNKTIENAEFEYFTYYRPRDIVSGDFFWTSTEGDNIILAVADCTGHGVPGAFMSLVGNTLLHQIVHETDVFSPKEILTQLNEQVTHLLNQYRAEKSRYVHDGMDISILCINAKNNTLAYSGAKRPMFFFRDGELQEIKGDRFPVGGHIMVTNKSFSEHKIELQKGDTLYVCSDGYADQFGGNKETKYMTKNFKKLLQKIHHMPMSMQQDVLETVHSQWKGDYNQTDDILILGVKF